MKQIVTLLFLGISLTAILGCGNSTATHAQVLPISQEPISKDPLPTNVAGEDATKLDQPTVQPVSNAPANDPPDVPSERPVTRPAKEPEVRPDPQALSTTSAGSTPGDPDEKKASTTEKSITEKKAAPKSDRVHEITFDDLNCGMQADIVFRSVMLTERVKELDGQRVRIAGYMAPDAKQKGITEFILLRNTECKFGPAGQADHLIQVKLAPGVTARYSLSPIEVIGTLMFKPFTGPDGNTWSIFEMTGESIGATRHRQPSGKDARPM